MTLGAGRLSTGDSEAEYREVGYREAGDRGGWKSELLGAVRMRYREAGYSEDEVHGG